MCGKIFRLSITRVSRLQAGSSFDLPNLATLQRARSAGHGAQGRELYDEEHNYRCGHSVATRAANDQPAKLYNYGEGPY